ncbi:hypothetical protein AGMMS49940_17180 [Spirochaetia bacterium]|nr:hypothetical protein AGMMS49940_17180 [Spirochaetia bacterium]
MSIVSADRPIDKKHSPIYNIRIVALFLCLLPGSAFAAVPSADVPVYEVSQKWLAVEIALLYYVNAGMPEDTADLLTALDEFSRTVEAFHRSPLYVSGAVTAFSPGELTRNITDLTELLSRSVREGQTTEVRESAILELSVEIHRELARWQFLDSEMADHIHMAYFSQFFILIAIIIIMTLFVWRLYGALEHSRARGKQSAAFSRWVVLAQEQERSRIARELHDSIAQELGVLEMRVQAIRRIGGDATEAGRAGIQELCTELSAGHGELIEKVRIICNGLVPPELRHQGLADALRRLCYDFGKAAGIECRLTVQEGFSSGPLSAEMQLQCFRLVQEALSNIRKHAEAAEATVLLRNADFGGDKTRKGLLICVSDDGKGFPPGRRPLSAENAGRFPSGHLGIRGMYERITILGGKLSFISEEGEGTMVKIEAPLL